jgi:hypothetical protein
MDAFVSSSEVGIEEEMTHPIGQDRVKTTTRKGKGKERKGKERKTQLVKTGLPPQ